MPIPPIAQGTGISVGSGGAWNVADLYAKFKIMKLLTEIDDQEKIAVFGRVNNEEEVMQEEIPMKRVEALKTMIFILKQLLGNCKFAIKEKKDVDLINEFSERIENVEDVFKGVSYLLVNDITKENFLEINEEHFKKCFDVLRNIKDGINSPLDGASLIFRHSEDIDLDDIMKQIVHGG